MKFTPKNKKITKVAPSKKPVITKSKPSKKY